jgi:hypothetical protein
LEIAVRNISTRAQHRCDICTEVSVRRNLVVKRLIRDVIRIDLDTLLLHPIRQLGLQLLDEIWALLQYVRDLIR